MKTSVYNYMKRAGKMQRRDLLKGLGAAGTMAAISGVATGASVRPAWAASHGSLRADILKIPGVGMGSPTDSDWQKVGEMCLGPIKEVVSEGEFAVSN